MKIAFIGGGNMGRAMLSAILSEGLAAPQDIMVSDKNKEILKQLKQDFDVYITEENIEAVSRGDIVVLAVKPQNIDNVMDKTPESLMADICRLNQIRDKLNEKIVKKETHVRRAYGDSLLRREKKQKIIDLDTQLDKKKHLKTLAIYSINDLKILLKAFSKDGIPSYIIFITPTSVSP